MKAFTLSLLEVFLFFACTSQEVQPNDDLSMNGPIHLHPENPHYFLYQGKTLALITSAEHYGAVLNLDFDYRKYLKTLGAEGMNYTRIFTGSYFEIPGESFNIEHNTLAPQPGRVITPWAQVSGPSGKTNYDLDRWNQDYFERLKDFMAVAAANNVIVEVTLFSSIYRDDHWNISPQNPVNNVNIEYGINRFDAQTLDNGDLLTYQEKLVSKIVQELNPFDNFFFEIQNEPWSDLPLAVYNIINQEELKAGDCNFRAAFADERSMAWQEKLALLITEEEKKLPKQHLIAQNYTSLRAPIPEVSDHISIINFHYAWPDAAEWNYHYNKVLGFDESGFAGSEDQVYRRQAWQFMLSGGGLFNNLDYSFFVGHEDGKGQNKAPGGGGQSLRLQLKALSDFLHSFELEKLKPNAVAIKRSPGLIPYVLSDQNKAFAIFLRGVGTQASELELFTGPGTYRIEPLHPPTGAYGEAVKRTAEEGTLKVPVEIPDGELALRILKVQGP